MSDAYRPAQLVVTWGVSDRRVRTIMSELESLGFVLENDDYGARRVPEALALAVGICRDQKRPLAELRLEPSLEGYLKREPDPLAELIELRADQAILRETLGAIWQALSLGSNPGAYRNVGWRFLGLPDPRKGL